MCSDEDKHTYQSRWSYRETFTGGVTPAAKTSDKTYNLFCAIQQKLQTIIGAHKIYQRQ